MKTIPLTQGLFAIVDDGDFDYLNKWKWSAERVGKTRYYAKRGVGPRSTHRGLRMQEAIMGRREGFEIDHRNGNGLDNRRENLRWATHGQNMTNWRRPNRHGRGVHAHAGNRSFTVQIQKDKQQYYIGTFATALEAQAAYNKAAIALHGEFAVLNLH